MSRVDLSPAITPTATPVSTANTGIISDAPPGAVSGRADFEIITAWVSQGASVLDLGCGDGLLLRHLKQVRAVRGYGVEISDENILACVKNGVNVIQSNLEEGLAGFEDGAFDCVILSQTLQAMRHTEEIVDEMLRVGREAIVTFPNFGYWRHRWQIGVEGQMPVSKKLPYQWYDTPNIHLCTIVDFEVFCRQRGIEILERQVLHDGEEVRWMPNLLGSLAVFRFRRAK